MWLQKLLLAISLNGNAPQWIKRLAFRIWRRMLQVRPFSYWVRRECERAIEATVRQKFFPDSFTTDDPTVDNWIYFTVCHLTGLAPEPQKQEQEIDVPAVKAVVAECMRSEPIRDLLSDYFAIDAVVREAMWQSSDGKRSLDMARFFRSDAKIPTLRKLWQMRKLLRNSVSRKRDLMLMRSSWRIDLSLSDLTQLATLVSVCLIVGGYFTTTSFYGHFGIHTANYFSVSDYLAASVERLSAAVLSAILALGGMFMGYLNASRISHASLVATVKRGDNQRVYAEVMIVLAVVYSYLREDHRVFLVLLPVAATIGGFRLAEVASVRYFARPVFSLFGIPFVICYSVQLFADVQKDFVEIGDGSYWSKHSERIEFAKDATSESDSLGRLGLIGVNSTFVFVADKTTLRPRIYPRDKVIVFVMGNATGSSPPKPSL